MAKDYTESIEAKEALVARAEELQDSTSWKSTSDKMKELMQQWKESGYAGPENDRLWQAFHAAQQHFFERQKQHYAELNEKQKEHKAEKARIIAEAKEVSEGSTDWKKTHEALEALFAQWKKAGSAGRSEDDKLWEEFQEVRNAFYVRRNAAKEEREKGRIEKRQAKSGLIHDVELYTRAHDYSEVTLARMKNLINEWKAIGSCGSREDDNRLWEQFKKAQDAYWFGKKFFSHSDNRQRA